MSPVRLRLEAAEARRLLSLIGDEAPQLARLIREFERTCEANIELLRIALGDKSGDNLRSSAVSRHITGGRDGLGRALPEL